ncbi:MAG TPA: hypothetical protein VIC62_11150 [Nakamurella sp.]
MALHVDGAGLVVELAVLEFFQASSRACTASKWLSTMTSNRLCTSAPAPCLSRSALFSVRSITSWMSNPGCRRMVITPCGSTNTDSRSSRSTDPGGRSSSVGFRRDRTSTFVAVGASTGSR